MIVGYGPFGHISVVNRDKLVKGRLINKQHYEIVVTDKANYDIIRIGNHDFTVVGIYIKWWRYIIVYKLNRCRGTSINLYEVILTEV